MGNKICPMCGNEYRGHPAISRTKGQEEICPACGAMQALFPFAIERSSLLHTRGVHLWADTVKKINFLGDCLSRHMRYDWGDDMYMEDWHANDVAASTDGRLLSAYNIPEDMQDNERDTKIWIITEADRSATTILFPSEY